MPHKHVVQSEDLSWIEGASGELFAHRRRKLGAAAGGQRIGCTMVELLPEKTAWPFHYHLGNEEALFVLRGQATLRIGDEQLSVREGDYVALPAGPQTPHQLTNTSAEPVRYLIISTTVDPDVIHEPDTDEVRIETSANLPPRRRTAQGTEPPTPSRPAADPVPDAEALADALDAKIDDEIEQMRRNLGIDEP